jgi:hypothetical protein
MPNFNPLAHEDYFSPNIEVSNGNNGVLRFKKYPKFGPILPSKNLHAAVEHTARNTLYARAPLPSVPSLSRAPSPQRPRLFTGAAPVNIGSVSFTGSATTRRRKGRKSKKSKKSRKYRR